jgi:prophage regulatory protein
VPVNIDNSPPKSANRGERRAAAARTRAQTSLPEARGPPLLLDINNLPPLLRCSDICRDAKRGYPGILPMTRSAFLTAVEDGYIPKGIKLGAKVIAWKREHILALIENGVVGRREQGRRARERAAAHRAAAGGAEHVDLKEQARAAASRE